MNQCLKCGKKAGQQAVFCDDCLDVMAQYPVKPGTVIHLPKRPNLPVSSDKDFDEPNLAAQLADQRKLIRWLTAIIAGLSILLVFMSVMLIRSLDTDQPTSVIGKNYTTTIKP